MRNPKSNIKVPDIITLVTDIAEDIGLTSKRPSSSNKSAKMRYMSQVSFADELIRTPYALLSKEQRHEYEQYPLKGATLLSNIRPLVPVGRILFCVTKNI